jgi:hypothetical protein
LFVFFSDLDEVESQYCFDLHFPEAKEVEHICMCLLVICTSVEKSLQLICPFIDWVICSFVLLVINFFCVFVYSGYYSSVR